MDEQTYSDGFSTVQSSIVRALRALEHSQQTIDFRDVPATQRLLNETVGDSLDDASTWFKQAHVPPGRADEDIALRKALIYLRDALATYSSASSWPEFGAAFIGSRERQRLALEILYEWRALLPEVEPYFRLAAVGLDELPPESAAPGPSQALGVTHLDATADHHNYSLYVPEYYDDAKQWPLIVSLHGGYGRGDEYLWTWLRPARSGGYIVLAPKSVADTWSILQPSRDNHSILAILDEVCATYSIDASRILLTGLSDGGTFSYLLGLEHHDRFSAMAPIAGNLSPMADRLLRAGDGKELPMHVVHGAHDAIFPVESIRSTNKLFESLGYDLTYTELPDWGHAMTYAINEELVLPWFERLSAATH